MRQYLRALLPYYRQALGTLLVGCLGGIVMNTAVVLPPILLGRAIDTVGAYSAGTAALGAVGHAALLYFGSVLLMESARAIKRWCLERTIPRLRSNMQADALCGVLAWPMARLHTTPIGDLMARIVGDAEVIARGTDQLTVETWDTFLMCASLAVALLVYDLKLSLLTLIPLPVAVLLAHATGRWIRARTIVAREANASLTESLQDDLAGLRVLRAFGRRATAVERLAHLSRRQADANLATARLDGGLRPLYGAIMSAGVVLVVWQGGNRVLDGVMTLGAFVAYLQLYLRFVQQGFRLPQVANAIQAAAAAYGRLAPLMAPALPVRGEPPFASFFPNHVAGIHQPLPAPPHVPAGPVGVSLEAVTFRYPGAPSPALVELSLELPPGSLVAVTGPVGCGKSALARAVLGLYPLEQGRVLLDGVPLEAVPAPERAARLGYLPQDAYLFSGTVRDNIRLDPQRVAPNGDAAGPGAGVQEGTATGGLEADGGAISLDEAVIRAGLEDDVRTFPNGLASEIGESGIRVSGGQRQRIALARALAAAHPHAPGLLVLDDPFSAVDVDTETKIAVALRDAFGPQAPPERRATIVLCSHRLASFPSADLVVLLEHGRIVRQGTHTSLLAETDGLYARIYHAQQAEQGRGGQSIQQPMPSTGGVVTSSPTGDPR